MAIRFRDGWENNVIRWMSPEFERCSNKLTSITRSPRIGHMIRPCSRLNDHKIEARLARRQIVAVRNQPSGRVLNASPLLWSDDVACRLQVGARFDFDHGDRATAPRDNVDFAHRRLHSTRQNGITF